VRPLVVLPLSLAVLCLVAGCGRSSGDDPGESPPVLRVGLEPEFEPMEYRTPEGEITGFDVELIQALGAEMGYRVELLPVAWDGIIAALKTKKIDVICSGMTITEKRKQSISFTRPYFSTHLCLLVNREKGEEIKSYRDLDRPDIVLAVKRATTGEKTAEELMPQAQRRIYDTENDCALEVANGRAHAFVYDRASILKHARQHARKTFTLLEPFNTEDYGIAVRQDDIDLLEKLNRALDAIQADGRYQRIKDRYIPRDASGE